MVRLSIWVVTISCCVLAAITHAEEVEDEVSRKF